MSDNEQKPAQKALIPHEHVVIPNEASHPKLQELAIRIRYARLLEDTCTMITLSNIYRDKVYSLEQIPNFLFSTAFQYAERMPFYILLAQMMSLGLESLVGRKEKFSKLLPDRKGKNIAAYGLALLSFTYLPSVNSRMLTYTGADLIKDIVDADQSPFNNLDSSRLLRDYNVGMFDAGMNLVLIKHPDSDYNRKPVTDIGLIVRRIAWQQPFKRARFVLNPPQVKEKDTSPWLDRKLAALIG